MLGYHDVIPTILFYLDTSESISYLTTCKELYNNLNNTMKLRLTTRYKINFDITNIINISRWIDLNIECIDNLSKYMDINIIVNMIISCNEVDNMMSYDEVDRDSHVVKVVEDIIPLFINNTLFEFDDIITNLQNIRVLRKFMGDDIYYSISDMLYNDPWKEALLHNLADLLIKNTFILGIPIMKVFRQISRRKWNDCKDRFIKEAKQIIYSTNKLDMKQLINVFLLIKDSYSCLLID